MERACASQFRSGALPAVALAFSLLAPHAAAAQGLPDFDIQEQARGTTLAAPERAADGALAASRLPGASISYDALTGAASRVLNLSGKLTGPSPLAPETVGRRFIADHPELFRLKDSEVQSLFIAHQYSTPGLDVIHLRFSQQVNGIPVFKGDLKLDISSRGEVLAASGSALPGLSRSLTATRPRLSQAEALRLAAKYAGIQDGEVPVPLALAEGLRARMLFDKGRLFAEDPVVELSYFPIGKGRVSLAWDTTVGPKKGADDYHILVDATTGELLFRHNYTDYASGLVFDKDAPQDGTPFAGSTPSILERVARPFDGSNLFNGASLFSSSNPHFNWWAGAPQTSTQSNNARAGTARAGIEGNLTLATSSTGTFNFTLDLSQDPSTYQEATATNLFFWNNRLHDIWYRFGFTEAARNFQTSNFNLGGNSGDAVLAHAQFNASGTSRNNASFRTRPDGEPGVMKLFVYDRSSPLRDGALDQSVVIHEYGHGVTNRLVDNANGLVGFQPKAMGEGWSDFQALLILAEPSDDINGTYAHAAYANNDFARGNRRQPYSTRPGVFTRTHANINGADSGGPEVHDAGEIMCETLWELYAKLVGKYGFTAGRDRMMQLFIDSLKLTPSGPTFLDYRNALLLADGSRFGSADVGDIWGAFAARGMGRSASTTGPSDTLPIEAYDVPTLGFRGSVVTHSLGVEGVTITASGPGQVGLTIRDHRSVAIPDNSGTGVTPGASVGTLGSLESVVAHVDLSHTAIGNLVINLVHPDGTRVVLWNRQGGTTDNLVRDFAVTGFGGKAMNGTWKLEVKDLAAGDAGILNSWGLALHALGTVRASAVTDSHGFYSIPSLPVGTYVVVPARSGETFTPSSRTITLNTTSLNGVDFTTGPVFSMSGRVVNGSSGLSGVLVRTRAGSATTDFFGFYTIRDLPADNYTVLASKTGFAFLPSSRIVDLTHGNVSGVDFAVTPTFSITGRVFNGSTGLGGVTVQIGLKRVFTSSTGFYVFRDIPPGTYTVRPSKSGFAFLPSSRGVTVTNANVTGVNFDSEEAFAGP